MERFRYEEEESRKSLAGRLAAQSFVLLKNEDECLPLQKGQTAFFGRCFYRPVLQGMGSGMSFWGKEIPSLIRACEAAGLCPVECLNGFYHEALRDEAVFDLMSELKKAGPELVASGEVYEIFGKYHAQPKEPELSEELISRAAGETDTALLTVGRGAGGEECDRRREDDFYLQPEEKRLIEMVCAAFKRVIILLNINGIIDVSWMEQYRTIKSVLYIGAPGEQGPAAVADVLTGKTAPSGKLAFTMGWDYKDWPSAKAFTCRKDLPEDIRQYADYGLDAGENGSEGFQISPVTLYEEGIYMGYRYFDTFGLDVAWPFGFGLSYAQFAVTDCSVEKKGFTLEISASVRNTSAHMSGRETVQVYMSAPSVRLEQPYQRFAGCAKTSLLPPGQTERVTVTVPVRELSSWEEDSASWILEAGKYFVRVGNSSRNTRIAGCLTAEHTILCGRAENILPLNPANREKLRFLSPAGAAPVGYAGEEREMEQAPVLFLTQEDVPDPSGIRPALSDPPAFVERLSDRELAAMAVGYGTGLPFGGAGKKAPCTMQDENGVDLTVMTHPDGVLGYVSPAMPKYGVPSVRYKDGPAGVGLTAWPAAMLLSCSFDETLWRDFGAACGYEAISQGVDCWLAPGLNLMRNPLGGRNFEYFSEDPYLTGLCGIQICLGAAENQGLTACPKHFALNEQETFRRGSARRGIDAVDSIVQERAARELYLKPFEMTVKNSPVRTIMTSFNKINGVFAAGSHDLCTKLLRQEWGFQGAVITDWGDMDIVADGADAVGAGNDVIMPGGPPVIRQILAGLAQGRLTRDQLICAVSRLLYFVERSGSYEAYHQKTERMEEGL